jgi:5-methylcytosine-specific restriction endonuclease McrA
MSPFEYPSAAHVRRHGPQGYRDYVSYRSWLPDEFSFRCVFCLRREQWDRPISLQIDHFIPVSRGSEQSLDYDNLLYTCSRGNLAKTGDLVLDPGQALLKSTVELLPDGSLSSSNESAQRLIDQLDLNQPELISFRVMWSEIVVMARQCRPELYFKLMGFPDDLPHLRKLRPPGGNTRPDGIEQSYFVQRERGELPATLT